MALQIEDYAIVGDTETVAVVGNNGSIDWLCLPRFDSAACFAALLGDESNGRWRIAPVDQVARVERQYRPGTLILDYLETAQGAVRVIDCMPPRDGSPDIIRIVEGIRGRVSIRMDLNPRFDYGRRVPIFRRVPGGVLAMAGPDPLMCGTWIQVEVMTGWRLVRIPDLEGQRFLFLQLVSVAPLGPGATRRICGAVQDRGMVESVVGSLRVPGLGPRDRVAVTHHIEGTDIRTNGRHRRGRHDVAPGRDRWCPELGLLCSGSAGSGIARSRSLRWPNLDIPMRPWRSGHG